MAGGGGLRVLCPDQLLRGRQVRNSSTSSWICVWRWRRLPDWPAVWQLGRRQQVRHARHKNLHGQQSVHRRQL